MLYKKKYPPYHCISKLSALQFSCYSATQHPHTLELFPFLPYPWVDLLAGWLHCEWCVYGEGYGPKHYSTQILIPLMALSALGLHVCTTCEWMHMGVSCICLSLGVCRCICVCEHFTAVSVIYLSPNSPQYTLLVSIKYQSHADCPPVLCLYNSAFVCGLRSFL